jgi:hypothetical protein
MYEKEVTEIENLINRQNKWRDQCINLIASENVVSQRVGPRPDLILPIDTPKGIPENATTAALHILTKLKTSSKPI